RFHDGSKADLQTLSSGERQIVSMLYAATYLESTDVVLIDEPEISLHIHWQRILLERMTAQPTDRQVIVCTHSPEIGAEFAESLIPVRPERRESGTTATTFQDDLEINLEDELDFEDTPF